MARFTDEERRLLEPFVSDPDANIYLLQNLPGIVGALLARYSRAESGARETLLREFVKDGNLDPRRASALIERVLIAYGDDSVGEMEGAYVCFEDISMLATKTIEERRIGGSPIEKSTRYVLFHQKDEQGRYRYYRPASWQDPAAAAAYETFMDAAFDLYADLLPPMQEHTKRVKPLDAARYDLRQDGTLLALADLQDESDRKAFRVTYNNDIRTKACDTLRCLLPLGTLTNVGVYGNGRFWQHVLSTCMTSPLPEDNDIAVAAKRALDTSIPQYVKRAARNEYAVQTRLAMERMAAEVLAGVPRSPQSEEVALLDRGEDWIIQHLLSSPRVASKTLPALLQQESDNVTVAHMLFPYCTHPLRQLRDVARSLPWQRKKEIIDAYVGDRQARRDRPGRAFESGYPWTWMMFGSYGTCKDLQRHRVMLYLRQLFTPMLGFEISPELEEVGFAPRVQELVEKAQAAHRLLAANDPHQAQYVTLHGSRVQWVMGMNDRELQHMVELRTGRQGHPSYRRACQRMYHLAMERSLWRGEVIQFVDLNQYDSARGDAEARQRAKERALEERAGTDAK